MICDIFELLFGSMKFFILKILYFKKIKVKGFPKINKGFSINFKGKSKLILGKKLRIRSNSKIRIYNGGIVKIGDNCFFNDNLSINCQKEISIGNNVICGPNICFIDNDHDYKNDLNELISKSINIGDNVWIGSNCTILKGVKIGNNCVIGAGTLVNKSIPNNCKVYNKKELIIKEL